MRQIYSFESDWDAVAGREPVAHPAAGTRSGSLRMGNSRSLQERVESSGAPDMRGAPVPDIDRRHNRA